MMTRTGITESDHGITGDFNVEIYDRFQRNFRNRRILATDRIIKSGIRRVPDTQDRYPLLPGRNMPVQAGGLPVTGSSLRGRYV